MSTLHFIAEINHLTKVLDALQSELATAKAQLVLLETDVDAYRRARFKMQDERDEARADRDAAIAELAKVREDAILWESLYKNAVADANRGAR